MSADPNTVVADLVTVKETGAADAGMADGKTVTEAELERVLRDAGLRPTRQRLSLASHLFGNGDRHVCAEHLHEEVLAAGIRVSLATVYNTLHQFTGAGLLRALSIDSGRTYFDTNMSDHHHFFIETDNEVVDVPASHIEVRDLPEPPDGMEIARVDVIVRLRPKD